MHRAPDTFSHAEPVAGADGEPVARKEGAAWYPRPARVVGMCVNVEDKEAELVAIGESGELVDTFKCRWLMTNIRVRRDGGGASALDIERKLGELERLALFMQESRCEAVAIGTCDLLCRKFKDEMETLAFGMGLMAAHPERGREYAQAYYRTSSRMDDNPLPEMPSISRAEIEAHVPFKVYLADETVPRLWAVTTAASVEHPEASAAQRTALSSARLLQDPLVESAHCIGPTGLSLLRLPLHPLMRSLPEEELEEERARAAAAEKEAEKELLVMLGEAENAGDKVTEAEKKLETELAYINTTNVTLLAKRADLEAKQASAEEEVSEAQARFDNLTSLENKTRDQETQLKMEKVMLDDKNRVADEVMTAMAALVKEEKKLATTAYEAKFLRKDLEKKEDLLAEVMAKAEALNGTLNESAATAHTAWVKANETADKVANLTAEKSELAANITSFREELKTAKITAGFAHEALREKQDSEAKQQERVTSEEYSLSRAEDEVTTLTVEETELDEELDGRINATKDAKHAYELASNATAKAKDDLKAERDLTEAREPEPK